VEAPVKKGRARGGGQGKQSSTGGAHRTGPAQQQRQQNHIQREQKTLRQVGGGGGEEGVGESCDDDHDDDNDDDHTIVAHSHPADCPGPFFFPDKRVPPPDASPGVATPRPEHHPAGDPPPLAALPHWPGRLRPQVMITLVISGIRLVIIAVLGL
jgi:hypothetical protein